VRVFPTYDLIPGARSFELPTFGLVLALGFLVGWYLWPRLLARYGADPARDGERAGLCLTATIVGVIVGGRLMFVAVEVARYASGATGEGGVGHGFVERPWEVFMIWKGGLVMYGGFAGAVLAGLWAARKHGLALARALDTGLVAGFVGQAIGRWGCLLVGDDYGSVVPERWRHLPFPITERVPSLEWLEAHPKSLFEHELAGELVWATQIWESANALLVALVGWIALRLGARPGRGAALCCLTYAANRFWIECFRGDDVRGTWALGLSTSQWISLPVILGALLYLARSRARPAAA
jgi:phosphatidylglycerol:prolipoprotein diacylglycerol transferase